MELDLPPVVAQVARIGLAVAYAVFALTLSVTLKRDDWTHGWVILLCVSLAASFVTLFHSTVFQMVGWPALLSMMFVIVVTIHVATKKGQRQRR